MTPSFPLAGLLRLRRLEQDQAAARFGAANARVRALSTREDAARSDSERIASDVDGAAALRAIAAARASSLGMLAELHALADVADAERDEALLEFGTARARTIGLEKLEARHAAALAAADLAAEQGVLDDLGSGALRRESPDPRGQDLSGRGMVAP
ncbi:flagellar export protein FliJ [Sinomonas sp. ASV322]|uniref:flagellar export protein FliJ n=1 Tax=Sinomonas sp. ASV322 TaxID=3041920 RepID=UPI0027DC3A3E|nr:flagellar export protein FliJ [Sinomonas sp. ASV322]MDQ4504074.1 flagellar export protein FliJ [Sinomonas sp. ASV322]